MNSEMSVNDKKASIIILSHNYLKETTLPCLESIFLGSNGIDFEVIVIDNGSSDDTVSYLKRLESQQDNLQCLFNKKNAGFAAGNNMGIRLARGDYLVLLNNDTVIIKGWLEKLIDPLVNDRNIGLVGPVTNSVGNEQMIHTNGNTVRDIIDQGEIWCRRSKGKYFETCLLGFFCVAMRKELPAEIGFLNESFGLGFYEDDDFCYRVKKAGFKLICLEDVFIYHRGSATFKYSDRKIIKKLLKENRKRLEQIMGTKYSQSHPRDKILELVNRDILTLKNDDVINDTLYRINNRLKLLDTLRPRGIIKRFIFDKKLNKARTLLDDMYLQLNRIK